MTKRNLEVLAHEAGAENWCLHPNGTSAWVGDEYDTEGRNEQAVVCQAPPPFEEPVVLRMEFIAACSPAAVLELLEEMAGMREDAQLLAELVEPIGLTDRQREALDRALGIS